MSIGYFSVFYAQNQTINEFRVVKICLNKYNWQCTSIIKSTLYGLIS